MTSDKPRRMARTAGRHGVSAALAPAVRFHAERRAAQRGKVTLDACIQACPPPTVEPPQVQ